MLIMKLGFLSLGYLIFFSVACFGADLRGIVTTSSGKPISEVYIYSRLSSEIVPKGDLGNQPFSTQTDRNGSFRLTRFGKVIFFSVKGFIPQARILKDGEYDLVVVLQENPISPWTPSNCTIPNKASYIGKVLSLSLPSNALFERNKIPHSLYFRVGFADTQSTYWLNLSYNPSSGFPDERYILDSATVTFRPLIMWQWQGIEMRGVLHNSTYWRHINWGQETLSYYDVSQDAAGYFDKIIDGLCLNREGVPARLLSVPILKSPPANLRGIKQK